MNNERESKLRNNDIFGNQCNDVFLEYHRNKVSKKSIIELAKLAGIF